MNPSAQWFSVVCDLEKDFVRFHGNVLNKYPKVIKELIAIMKPKYAYIDDFAIACYVRTRPFIRMKEINKKEPSRDL